MKKSLYSVFGVLCFLNLVLVSCEKPNPEEALPPSSSYDNHINPEPIIKDQLVVMRLSSEMYENVIVSPIVDSIRVDYSNGNVYTLYYDDSLALCNLSKLDTILSEFAQTQLNIIGTSPYVVLNNGFVIIDWKWSYFIPLSGAYRDVRYISHDINAPRSYSTNGHYLNGDLANEEYYLLSIKWPNLKKLISCWDIKEGKSVHKPEMYYIALGDIEKYGNCQANYSDVSKKYNLTIFDLHSTYKLYTLDADKYKTYVKECDNLQAQYVEVLNQMINNNDLETWKQH